MSANIRDNLNFSFTVALKDASLPLAGMEREVAQAKVFMAERRVSLCVERLHPIHHLPSQSHNHYQLEGATLISSLPEMGPARCKNGNERHRASWFARPVTRFLVRSVAKIRRSSDAVGGFAAAANR